MSFVPLRSGAVEILGMPREAALKRGLVAYVPQAEEVDWTFPVLVEDVVMMGRYGHLGWLRRPSPRDRELVAAALERVGRVILLDEPVTGVDVTTEDAIVALLKELRDRGG